MRVQYAGLVDPVAVESAIAQTYSAWIHRADS